MVTIGVDNRVFPLVVLYEKATNFNTVLFNGVIRPELWEQVSLSIAIRS